MSNINVRTKFIFVHVPRTGGVSMEHIAWNTASVYGYRGHFTISDFASFGIDIGAYFKWCFVRNPWSKLLSGYDHSARLKQLYPTFSEMVKAVYKYKATYGRLNYMWGYYLDDGIPCADHGVPVVFLYSQMSLITHKDAIKMDFIGRFERLHEDWAEVCKRIKALYPGMNLMQRTEWTLPKLDIRIKNDPNFQYVDKPYWEYYTDEMRDAVGEVYANDIKQFGYTFGS